MDGMDLAGKRVLDVGCLDGRWSFEAQDKGAVVTATDLYPAGESFNANFHHLNEFLGSKITYVQSSIYGLSSALAGQSFDVVLVFGVLYHLKHPLLGLQSVSKLLSDDGVVAIESAVLDDESEQSRCLFYYRRKLVGDDSNWWLPNQAALREWMLSVGLKESVELELSYQTTIADKTQIARSTGTFTRVPDFKPHHLECWHELDKRLY